MNQNGARIIAELQDRLNKKINPNWIGAKQDFIGAGMIELAEAIDSTAWKWWKHQEVDYDNIKVELVDYFHFELSHMIEAYGMETAIEVLTKVVDEPKQVIPSAYSDIVPLREGLKRLIVLTASDNPHMTMELWTALWYSLGMTVENLAKEYLTKNLLNIFRQDNGYKDGTYKKMWTGTDGKEYEDNVIAFEISAELDHNSSDFEELFVSELTKAYNK